MKSAVPHTLKVFDEDLDQLRAMVCEMGGLAEEAIGKALPALICADDEQARRIIADDARIDALAQSVEREALHLIALRGPLADDLRDVLAALKISAEVARIGDCARNIARRTMLIEGCQKLQQMKLMPRMGAAAAAMTTAALDSFSRRDPAGALAAVARDEEVDQLYDAIFRALVSHMSEHPGSITTAIHLLFVAQNLERIGDHAVNVARIVHFAATGGPPAPPLAREVG